MSIITLRLGKGSPLTNDEVDANFTNLNTDKVESITSADGSVIVSGSGTTRDLSVGTAANTGTLISQIRNETGATLTKGTVVYISGASGNKALVSKALASGDTTSAQTYGMVQADIPHNQNGYVVVIGAVSGLNTSAFPDGTQLYLSGETAGTYTSTKPYAPTHLVYVGIVTYSHANQGAIEVKIQNGYEMDELHNVSAQSPTNGQMLVYNSTTGLWTKSNSPILLGATIDNTTIGATTPSTGMFTTLTATGQTSLGGAVGSESFRAVTTASAVNWLQAQGGTTGNTNFPRFAVEGSDANVWMTLLSKGNAGIRNFANGAEQFRVSPTASAVNYVQVTGGATTKGVIQSAQGSDSNISYVTQSKGTGAIDLAAGSSGVNISNGGTVTAITGTAFGSNYTSAPSVAISAPTTAGGVQATATIPIQVGTVTISSGGTGYTVNDVLTVVGGTFTTVCQLTVSAVSGGVITAVTTGGTARGNYTVAPSNPASVTGGTGSGATFTLNFSVSNNTTFTITNAGSGYVEQPTVTFSGGGGSGAAAYATVGSGTVIRSLGSTMSFSTPNGESFRVTDQGVTSANYASVRANSTGNSPFFLAQGSDTNVGLASFTKGTGSLVFGTNSGTTQVVVAHTASAVNFVQVTGAATTGLPQITAQGSDTNPGLLYITKGVGEHRFASNASAANIQFRIPHTASAVNYGTVTGAAAGASPVFSVAGTDTNIDLALTPKGTGVVKVGTNTVLHAGNYNSYSPTLTGTGASGTWGISITGNAATVTSVTSSQVTTALGYTPYNSSNPSGYITGITSGMVTTALGFTPYDNSNPNGYISGITSGMVTTALGFTPYNNSNPSGYITSSALSGYLTSASAASTYLALSGGTLSGELRVNTIRDTAGGWVLGKYGTEVSLGSAGLVNEIRFNSSANAAFEYRGNAILHAGNYNSYALPLTGGTMTGNILVSSTSVGAQFGNLSVGYGGAYNTLQTKDGSSELYLQASSTGNINIGNGGGYTTIYQSTRSPIFYDSDNTAYYANPAATSNFQTLEVGTGPGGNNAGNLYIKGNNSFRWIAGYAPDYGVGNGFGLYSDSLGGYYTSLSTSGNWWFGLNDHGSSYRVSINGTGYATGDLRAPIFYDSNNTAYYVDPNSSSISAVLAGPIVAAGGLQSATSGYTSPYNIFTLSNTYNTSTYYGIKYVEGNPDVIQIIGGNNVGLSIGMDVGDTTASSSLRAPIFYDSNNTAYYLDPASNSVLTTATFNVNGSSTIFITAAGTNASMIKADGGDELYIGGNNTWQMRFSGANVLMDNGGYLLNGESIRAPLFYDSNDTSRYVDPNGTSVLYYMNMQRGSGGAGVDGAVAIKIAGLSNYDSLELGTQSNYDGFLRTYGNNIHYYSGHWRTTGNVSSEDHQHYWYTSKNGSANWSTWKMQLDQNAALQVTGSIYAPIFYDYNDTTFYLDPNSTGLALSSNGIVSSGTGTAGGFQNRTYTGGRNRIWSFGNADGYGVSYFQGGPDYIGLHVSGTPSQGGSDFWVSSQGVSQTSVSSRAPIFYDSNNTGYYTDPNGTSNVLSIYAENSLVRIEKVHVEGGEIRFLSADSSTGGWIQGHSGGLRTVDHGWTQTTWNIDNSGNSIATSSHRAPIFYDSGDTGYYINANGSSYLYGMVLSGSMYFRPQTWIQMDGSYGIYWPNNYGIHIYPTASGTYTQLQLDGSKNSYSGMYLSHSAVNGMMYDSAGNGGVYREANGKWYWYYLLANDCMGIGTSSTNSAYGIYCNKGAYLGGRVDGTIFYDASNTGYYVDPNDTGTSVRVAGNVTAYYSDMRLKTHLGKIENALEKVRQLEGFYYEANEIAQKLGYKPKREVGVSAQAVHVVLPEIVTDAPINSNYLTIDYERLTPLLIEAMKEQDQEVVDLRNRVAQLESLITKLIGD